MGIDVISPQLRAVLQALKSFSGFGGDDSDAAAGEVGPESRFDRVVDAISRLPRLILLLWVIIMVTLAWFDHVHFVVWADSMSHVPGFVQDLSMIIVGGWMTAKAITGGIQAWKQSASAPAAPTPSPVQSLNLNAFGRFRNTYRRTSSETLITQSRDARNSRIDAWKAANGTPSSS